LFVFFVKMTLFREATYTVVALCSGSDVESSQKVQKKNERTTKEGGYKKK